MRRAPRDWRGRVVSYQTVFERLFRKTRKRPDGCWEWTGSKGSCGYGHMRVSGRTVSVHRIAYNELVGPIPDGLTLDHLCRNRWCVNPEHLEPVTNRENVLRGVNPPAQNHRKQKCLKGHPFDLTPGGRRGCSVCRCQRTQAYRKRHRARYLEAKRVYYQRKKAERAA